MKRYWLLLFFLSATVVANPRLVVLDVGEGQALLVQQGDRGILIDTGHPGAARHVLDRLNELGVKHLDYMILTHLHPDHAGGYFRLREAWPETPVLHSGHPLPNDVRPDLTRWVKDALQQDARQRIVGAGDALNWRGITLKILWPDEFVSHDLNHHSLVLLLRHQDARILIMGDAPQQAERELLRQNSLPENIDIVVVGHHGSKYASSMAFIEKIRPRLAVISVNRNNIRGYPSAEVVQRWKKAGAKVLRTDRQGEIHLDW
ncbi:ComEC/Rec2 family competence protein [Thiolapillus sp.]